MTVPASPASSPRSSTPSLTEDGGEEANVALRADLIV
jgi:hypothetical protein